MFVQYNQNKLLLKLRWFPFLQTLCFRVLLQVNHLVPGNVAELLAVAADELLLNELARGVQTLNFLDL